MNYYKRHIGDYSAATSHLTLIEHGAYARLLDLYYVRERAIPDAQAERLCGARTQEEKAAVRNVLQEFFVLIDPDNPEKTQMVSELKANGYDVGYSEPVWVQIRCEKELKLALQKAELNQKNGKKGGRPRKQTRKPLAKPIENIAKNEEKTQMVSEINPEQTQSEPGNNLNPLIHQSTNPLNKKDSEAYASGAVAPQSSADQSAEIILDARTRLFREGLALLARMTGKPPDKCRSFLGKVLKDMGDDCPAAFAVIEAAANARPADPVSWIAAAVQERKKPAQPAKKTNKLRPGIDYDPRYFFPNTREEIAALPPPKPETREYESWQCCGLGYPPSDPPGTPRSFIM